VYQKLKNQREIYHRMSSRSLIIEYCCTCFYRAKRGMMVSCRWFYIIFTIKFCKKHCL